MSAWRTPARPDDGEHATAATGVPVPSPDEPPIRQRLSALQRTELLGLYSASPESDPYEFAAHLAHADERWAALIFEQAAGAGAALAYDSHAARWTAALPVWPGGPLMNFGLNTADLDQLVPALLEAVELTVGAAPPAIATYADADNACCVRYDPDAERWEAFGACDDCGGGWLRMRYNNPRHEPLVRLAARRYLTEAGGLTRGLVHCAFCVAQNMRDGDGDIVAPTCWFDPTAGTWMLAEPFGGDGACVSVPLDLDTFFLGHRTVLAAARRLLAL